MTITETANKQNPTFLLVYCYPHFRIGLQNVPSVMFVVFLLHRLVLAYRGSSYCFIKVVLFKSRGLISQYRYHGVKLIQVHTGLPLFPWAKHLIHIA